MAEITQIPTSASDKFAAESQFACPTLWQPFLAEITQIPAKCDLPLPPKEWTNMNQEEIKQSPQTIPFNVLKETIPHDRINFGATTSKKSSNKGKQVSKPKNNKLEAKANVGKQNTKDESNACKNTKEKSQQTSNVERNQNVESNKVRPSVSRKGKKSAKGVKKSIKGKHNKTYESHPNMSKYKRHGKKQSDDLPLFDSFIDSDSDWETDNTESRRKNVASNVPKRVEECVHLTNLRDNVEEVVKKKTVCEDGVEVLNSSTVKMKVNLQSNKSESEGDGPLRMAPDPTEKLFESGKENHSTVNPQRQWVTEAVQVPNSQSMIVNNYPLQQHGKSVRAKSPAIVAKNSQFPNFRDESYTNNRSDDCTDLEVQSSDNETGFEYSSAYKKKLKRLEKLKQNNVEELASMKRKIATRFLLTRAKPNMTIEAVELYILENFDVDEVYVRKNPMKYNNHSSFIFITNSDEELDVDDFEDHRWPGEIQCFFAPNERNRRQ